MATYTYKCESCEHEFDVEQSISAPKGADCPECGKHTEKRLITGSSFLLKGGGWAKDLYHKG